MAMEEDVDYTCCKIRSSAELSPVPITMGDLTIPLALLPISVLLAMTLGNGCDLGIWIYSLQDIRPVWFVNSVAEVLQL